MQKFAFISGVLISLLGLSIMFTPMRVYFLIGWLIGFIMVCNGVSTLLGGMKKKSRSRCIAGFITTFIGGALVLGDSLELIQQSLIIYLVAGGIIVTGLIECFVGYSMMKDKQKGKNGLQCFIMGCLSLGVGLFGMLNQQATVMVIGAVVGFHIVKIGVNICVYARDFNKGQVIDLQESLIKK